MPFAIAVLTLLFSQRGTVDLPDVSYVDPTYCEPVRVTASYQRAANVPAQVERLIIAKIKERRTYDKAPRSPEPDCIHREKTEEVWCRAPCVSGKLVSIECAETCESVHPEFEPWAINIEMGESLKEISRDDLFANDRAEERFWDLARQALKESAPDASEEQLDDIDNVAKSFTFTAAGIEVQFDRHAFFPEVVDVTVPYEQLRGIVRSRYLPKGRA